MLLLALVMCRMLLLLSSLFRLLLLLSRLVLHLTLLLVLDGDNLRRLRGLNAMIRENQTLWTL